MEDRRFSKSVAAMEIHFRSTLNKIAHDPRYTRGELVDVVRFILETASHALDCARTSVWEYVEHDPADGGKPSLRCLAQYEKETGAYSEGTVLHEADAASFLGAMERDSLLVIDDVTTDLRCVELMDNYLTTHGIMSMLDAPFQFNGELAGVLCCEHVGSQRTWTTAEQHFGANMASLVTIATESDFRRKTEKRLREEQDRYRSLVEDLPLGLIIVVNEEIVFVNNEAANITHSSSAGALKGMKLSELFPHAEPWELHEWEDSVRKKPHNASPTEYRFTLRDGAKVTFEVTASPVNWMGQSAIQVIFRDVTEAAYAQLRLKRSERLLSQAQKIARLGSWVWDIEKGTTECSSELRKLLGISVNPSESPLLKMAHPEDAPRLKAAQRDAIRNNKSYQITYRINTASGLLWLEETGVPELGPEKVVIRVHGTSRDITRQKFAELEAQATEDRFSALGDTFPGGFIYCDLSGRYLFINKTYAEWFDIDPADYLGKHIQELVGDKVYSEIEQHIKAVTEGKSVTLERSPTLKKEGVHHLQVTYAPDIGANGEMRGFFGLQTDITETKRVEKALRQAQKMEAMGQLTGGIAHDFNNILAILMGNLELAKHTSTREDSQEYIRAALQGVERGVAITQKLLGFARSNTPGEQSVRIDTVIDELRDIITQSIGTRVDLKIETGEDIWNTRIDPGDFEDALINLSINARDAMPNGGTLLIKTENKTLDDTYKRIHPRLAAGDYVLISVTDTGTGMDAHTRERLFEPFFTTKPEGKGTGLGMSMVFGFVKRSRGEAVVYSAEGEGTTINIYLPRSEPTYSHEARQDAVDEVTGTRESILVVDDEEMVANVAASILNELGYQTKIATSTGEALELLSRGQRIDLLFSDVVMPNDLNGFEFARAAAKVQPSIKVLLTSGFSKFSGMEPEDEDSRSLAENILAKPYNRKELAFSVRKVLDARI